MWFLLWELWMVREWGEFLLKHHVGFVKLSVKRGFGVLV